MSQILIIEDEPRISAFVSKGLRSAGFQPTVAASGSEGLSLAMTGDFELILLDVGLPDIDGFDVLRQIRDGLNDVPVIMLTARTGLDDTLAGLNGGADDYLAKPFRFEELIARIRLRLRPAANGASVAADPDDVLDHGGFRLDLRARQAEVDGRSIDLSAREFALAEAFLRNAGQVLSREQLLSRVWGYDFDPGSNVVDVYVRYLRNKLGSSRIETIRGAGYRLV
ncbi:response regulator transcription factor [Zhihengliuella halotolerans]|uniref:DNA-binding response OmpR family regulator n=1 Tax=Zhihengliuella halotolerans TaxID=370736 RepID=A0A4Q8ABF5_9MICC|nr:response regulator transcription factor [Zhihengliuella halotolerans]RZU60905.1 DNA-binding response OmpR family regulator [Zhihengliuella halotolerans]